MITNSFTKPEIFEISELELSYHPNFKSYFTNPKIEGSGFWFYNDGEGNNARLDEKFIKFLNQELNGGCVQTFCPYGDFAGVIRVCYHKDIFEFISEKNPDKYFHICQNDKGTALSKYIVYLDNENERENIDGLHEQRVSS